MFAQRDDRRHVHRRREHVVRALTFVDVIVRMDLTSHPALAAQQFAGAVGQHLIHVHVALCAGTGLPDGQRELILMTVLQHFIGCRHNGTGFIRGEQA